MAASNLADELALPTKLDPDPEAVRGSLHRPSGSARVIGATVMRPDDPDATTRDHEANLKRMVSDALERAMFPETGTGLASAKFPVHDVAGRGARGAGPSPPGPHGSPPSALTGSRSAGFGLKLATKTTGSSLLTFAQP